MGKFTFKDRQERGEDFLRFLKTENININGMDKTRISEYYNGTYKAHLQQISPNKPVPSFSSILQPLFMNGIIHLRNNLCYEGPHSFFSDKKRDSESDARSDGFQRRQLHRKFAVNQHKILKQIEKSSSAQNVPHSSSQNGSLPEFIVNREKAFFCELCSAPCTSDQEVDKHVEGRRHRVSVLVHRLKTQRNFLTKDKNGVKISVPSDVPDKDSIIIILREQQPRDITLTINNVNQTQNVELVSCELLKRIRVFQLDDVRKVTESQNTVVITPGCSYDIHIRAEARNIGSYHSPIALQFKQVAESGSAFHIVRYLHAKCVNETIEDIKKGIKLAKHDKQSRRCKSHRRATRIINGFPLPKHNCDKLERKIELKQYIVPDPVRKMINQGLANTNHLKQFEKIELTSFKKMLDDPITAETYSKKMSALMHFEEIQMEADIEQYDMEDATMTPCHYNTRLLLLDVPGLAESRPSVLRGDQLYVRIVDDEGNPSEKEYQGFVHDVFQYKVALGFGESLMKEYVPNMKFNIRFIFTRLPIRLMHRACELVEELSLDKLIFPRQQYVGSFGEIRPVNEKLNYFARSPSVNEEQDIAIRHIVSGTSRPAPYLVFGPPGTGKTFTIVEAMKQVWKCIPNSHILACAPSNTAADLIVSGLKQHLPSSDIFRINATSRAWDSIPEDIRDVCNYDRLERRYFYPNREEVMKYRIVVTTLVTAGRLASADFPSDHFTHVFIDEAGYAIEPECLIAIAGILDCNPNVLNGGQLVLAGDPMQLRPILRSPFAIKYHLDMSFLERLMENEMYMKSPQAGSQPTHYNQTVLTKLVKNYRSHKVIHKLSSDFFYEGELVEAAPEIREMMCEWEGLPRKHFPLIFHAVIGEDMREEKSPSFFNLEEVVTVTKYVKELVGTRVKGTKLTQEHIGVISPYRKQVQKIQKQLSKLKPSLDKIKVGSVEEFQGSEKLIIIVSTVRSNPRYLSVDTKYNLGFLRNPKRFNVTMTRAKALVIVIGNPQTLQMDTYWRELINYCKENGSVHGKDLITDPEEDLEDIIQRMAAVQLEAIDPEIVKTSAEEHPWRKDM